MIISKIELKNIVGLYNGCGLDKLKVNLENDYSKIILILGKNGSGKSTFVNSLDPFAVETIRENKEGYKKIVYKNKKIKYIIEHIYKPTKTGHSVKSYIVKVDKDGTKYDLNPNGNSTSFNEIVELELGVSKSSMRLIKMGIELGSIVTMTPSERKKFINVFTAETGIYNKYYKKINDDFRTIKKLLQSTENKIVNIGNIDSIKAEFKICSESIENVEKTIASASNEKAVISNEIIKLSGLYNNVDINYNKFKKCSNDKTFLKCLDVDYDEIYKQITLISSQIEVLKSAKDTIVEQINKNTQSIKEIEDEISSLNEMCSGTSNIDMEDLQHKKQQLQEKINKYSHWLRGKNLSDVDDNQISSLITSLTEYRNQILNIFNDSNIDSKLLSEFDISNDYTNMMSSMYGRKNIVAHDIIKTESRMAILNNDIKTQSALLEKKPDNCQNLSCPLLQGFSKESIDKSFIELETLTKTKNDLYDERDNIENKLLSLALCKQLKDIIIRMSDNVDDNDIIKSCIKSIKHVDFNILFKQIEHYQHLLEEVTLYKELKESVDSLNNITLEINKSEFSKSIEVRKVSLRKEMDNILNNNRDLVVVHKTKDKDIEKLEKSLSEINEIYKYKDDVTEYKLNYELIQKINETDERINELKKELEKAHDKVIENNKIKNSLLEQKDKLLYKKKYYNELTRYRKVILDNYGKVEAIHNALSVNEGIPLIFIKTLLKQIRTNANRLLKSAFGNDLKLKKFKIDEKEFNMPITGKGDGAKDVRMASSGERSIISLAISLALSQYVNSKYNIIILDELDGPLDFNLRRSFLDILEYQCDMMNIKQVFNISHNSTFNDYKSNVVLLKGADYLNMKEKNILYKFD